MTDAELEQLRQLDIVEVVAATGLTVVKVGANWSTREHDSLMLWPRTRSWFWFARGVGGDVIAWAGYALFGDRWRSDDPDMFKEACASLLNKRLPPAPRSVLAPEKPPAPLPQDLHLKMHAALQDADLTWWLGKGLGIAAIDRFKNGVYQHSIYGRCYTIPIVEDGALVNIRMRLENPADAKSKYRPFDSGRGTQLFNCDVLTDKVHGVIVTAGEIKAEVLSQFDLPAVSPTGGCSNWRPEWTPRLQYCKLVYIAFDPKEEAAAERLAGQIGERARIVTLPDKPDDFVLTYGADALRYHLKHALPLAKWRRAQTVSVPEKVAQALYAGAAPVNTAPQRDVPWRGQLLGGKSG